MEFVRVTYPTTRPVKIDGEMGGSTNDVLLVEAGTHIFDLGTPVDYIPPFRRILVTGTTVLTPLSIAFASIANQR